MSVSGTSRSLFGARSLSSMLDASRSDGLADRRPTLGFWDGLMKSAKRQDIKTSSLSEFQAKVMQTKQSPLALLRTVLEHAKVDTLPLIKASYSDIIESASGLAGKELGLSIHKRQISFNYSPTDAPSASGLASTEWTDAGNYARAHEISAQVLQHPEGKKAAAADVGALREAIFNALRASDAYTEKPERANAVGLDPDVRKALNDLGMASFVISARTDKAGGIVLGLSDLWDELKDHIPKSKKSEVSAAMQQLARRAPDGERLLTLTTTLRAFADPQKRGDFHAAYETDGKQTSFHFDLGRGKIAFPAVAAKSHVDAIARDIAIDNVQAPLASTPFNAANGNLVSRLIGAAFPKGAPPTAETLAMLSDQLNELLKVARAVPKDSTGWEQHARRTILAAEEFIAKSMQNGPEKETQLAALEAVVTQKKASIFAATDRMKAISGEREKVRVALVSRAVDNHATAILKDAENAGPAGGKKPGEAQIAQARHILANGRSAADYETYLRDNALDGKIAEKLDEAEQGIRMRVDRVDTEKRRLNDTLRQQLEDFRNADVTALPAIAFVPKFVGFEREGQAGLFVNNQAAAWAPAADAGANSPASPSTISITAMSRMSAATTLPPGGDTKSRSPSIASSTGELDLSRNWSQSASMDISRE